MFEQPEAKRVRRDELFESDPSDESSGDEAIDGDLRARLNEQIAKSLGLLPEQEADRQTTSKDAKYARNSSKDSEEQPDTNDDHEDDDGGKSADEFEFQLFSTSAPTTKVVLDDENLGDGAFVRKRPESHYLVTRIPEEQRLRYAFAAITGDEVLERAKARSWGLELPWKVVHATQNGKLHTLMEASRTKDPSKGRGRPGKKKRIAMRTKARAEAEKSKELNAKLAEKEEQIKDKKKRLNRAKKLRRRAKAKEQKGGDGGGGEDDSGESDNSA
ncbi:hypothetical protein CC79DRAFT_350244 [Sarocladium strictum]